MDEKDQKTSKSESNKWHPILKMQYLPFECSRNKVGEQESQEIKTAF